MRQISVRQHRRWTNRAVAREFDHRGQRWLWLMVLGVVAAAMPLAMWQLQQNECLRLSYEAAEQRVKIERLEEEARRLRAHREALRALDSIEIWADAHGLVHPTAAQVVVVGEAPRGGPDWLAANVDGGSRSD